MEKRIAIHNAGKGARYTRAHLPVTLCASWSFESKGEALRTEKLIKGLSRARKERLIGQGGSYDQGSSIFCPKGEPFFEGSKAFEEWLRLLEFGVQDVPACLEHRSIGAV